MILNFTPLHKLNQKDIYPKLSPLPPPTCGIQNEKLISPHTHTLSEIKRILGIIEPIPTVDIKFENTLSFFSFLRWRLLEHLGGIGRGGPLLSVVAVFKY